MAYSHDVCIKDKMTQLANVSESAIGRITPQILSNSARELLENIGEESYTQYVSGFNLYDETSYGLFDAKEFNSLTNEEKAMRYLIFSEAYFGLYYLAIALKNLVNGVSSSTRLSSGQANIYGSGYDEIIANAEKFKEEAIKCLSFSTDSSDDSEEDIHSDGSVSFFIA